MAENKYLGLPRKEIPWYPTLNPESCNNCGLCLKKCGHNVYAYEGGKVTVAQPYECVVGCESCRYQCAFDAISFPGRDELKKTLKKLREKYGYGG